MGEACSAYGEGRGIYWFWWGNLREGDYLGDPGIDGRITLMITLMFYQAMLVNKCLNMTSCCVCTAATSGMLTCSKEVQRDFSLSWDPKNGNLVFSITWLTHLCSMCGCCNGKCVAGESWCNESKGIQNWFHKILCKLGTQCAHRQTAVCWHNWRSNKTFSPFSYHKVCSKSSRWSMAFMKGQVNNMQTARPYTAHTSLHVINVNWILASNKPKMFKKFHCNWAQILGKIRLDLFTITFINFTWI
jgi:hypothetical protein